MQTPEDIEIAKLMANAWRLNDERNRKQAAQQLLDKQNEEHWRKFYAPVDDAIQE